MLFAKGGMIKMISRILSSFCILALCFGVFLKFYGIIWGISLGYFEADWVILCVSGPMLLYAAIALFFELLNFKSRFFPKGVWIVLIWLDVFIYGIFLWFYVFKKRSAIGMLTWMCFLKFTHAKWIRTASIFLRN